MRWLDFLFPLRTDEAVLRDISIDDFLALMVPRLVPETRPGTVALLPFNNPLVRSAIHEAKYHGSERAFSFLATALSEYLCDADDVHTTRSNLVVLVPVPLGKERRKERGFNQVEEITNRAAHELDIAVNTTLLERTRETISQVSLTRTLRERNMKGAFECPSKLEERSKAYTYILVDDVLTTGATLQAAIDALKGAGAKHIIPLALAH